MTDPLVRDALMVVGGVAAIIIFGVILPNWWAIWKTRKEIMKKMNDEQRGGK